MVGWALITRHVVSRLGDFGSVSTGNRLILAWRWPLLVSFSFHPVMFDKGIEEEDMHGAASSQIKLRAAYRSIAILRVSDRFKQILTNKSRCLR
jgi:hypothetical protein